MTSESLTQFDKFHNHLDRCAQCHDHPFDPCRLGMKLIESAARELIAATNYPTHAEPGAQQKGQAL
jgi:hypothetical protein